MELSDYEDEKPSSSNNLLGNIAGIACLLGGITCLAGLYGAWLSYTSMPTEGTNDPVQESNGLRISLYSHVASFSMLTVGYVCQLIAFYKFDFAPKWMWKILLLSGSVTLLSSITPYNISFENFIMGGWIVRHVITKRTFYQNKSAE